MESPGGLNIKRKFQTLMKRSSLDSPPSKCQYDVELAQTYFNNSDLRRGKTSFIALNKNCIQAPLEEEEEDEILKGVEQEYYRQTSLIYYLHALCFQKSIMFLSDDARHGW